MAATKYALVRANLFDDGYTPAASANGALCIILDLLKTYDATNALVSDPFQDVINKISAVIPDGPTRRELLQLLEAKVNRSPSTADDGALDSWYTVRQQ